jgi:hypothetical protein
MTSSDSAQEKKECNTEMMFERVDALRSTPRAALLSFTHPFRKARRSAVVSARRSTSGYSRASFQRILWYESSDLAVASRSS